MDEEIPLDLSVFFMWENLFVEPILDDKQLVADSGFFLPKSLRCCFIICQSDDLIRHFQISQKTKRFFVRFLFSNSARWPQ